MSGTSNATTTAAHSQPSDTNTDWGDDGDDRGSGAVLTQAVSQSLSSQIAVTTSGGTAQVSEYETFEAMGLSRNLLRGIYSSGFNHPSPIQRKGIVPIMSRGNVLAQANSGSGKTAMFSIGTLHNVDGSARHCQAILLSPTRDLALQTSFVVRSLASFLPDVRIVDMIGGITSNDSDRYALRQKPPHVVVGTPGRVLHMITSRALDVNSVHTIVLDEADEMLTQGFREQLVEIFQTLDSSVQIVFCSATMPAEALDISARLMGASCTKILVPPDEVTLKGIRQFYVEVAEKFKIDTLLDLYSMIPIAQSVVFCNTKRRVDIVAERMRERGHSAVVMSSDMTITDRMNAMQEFRSGHCRILISSNLIARGIDVQQVSLVVNYDLPREKESYIHRIGRSGRYGRKGVAINLVSPADSNMLSDIIVHYSTQVDELPSDVPSVFE